MPFPGVFFPPPALFRPRVRMRAGNPAVPPPPPGAPGYEAQMAARRAQERADARLARRLALEEDVGVDNDPFAMLLERDWGLGGMDAGANVAMALLGLALGGQENVNEPARRRPPLNPRNQWVRPRQENEEAEDPRERRRERGPRVPRTPEAPEPPAAVRNSDVHSAADDDDIDSRTREAYPDGAQLLRRMRVQVDDRDIESSSDERRRRRLGRRATVHGGRPSMAAMAGLADAGAARGRDRVGGWLEHVAGAPERTVWDYEVR